MLFLFTAWKQSHWKFKGVSLIIFVVAVIDVVVAAVEYGVVDALWRLEVLVMFGAVAFFYAFVAPIIMHLLHIGALIDLKRGRKLESVLIEVILASAVCFTFVYVYLTTYIKAVMMS